MKNRKNLFSLLAWVGFALAAGAITPLATANEDPAAKPRAVSEEAKAEREARRAKIASMSDEERAAAREQRRQKRGEMSGADRQARRDKMASRRAGREPQGQRASRGQRGGGRRG